MKPGAWLSVVLLVPACLDIGGGEADPGSGSGKAGDSGIGVDGGSCWEAHKLCNGQCTPTDQVQTGCAEPGCAPCNLPHATATCGADGQCALSVCEKGWADCDATSPGCETATNTMDDCGACGQVCLDPAHGTATCASGTCQRSCNPDYANCDKDWNNGCEKPCGGSCSAGACCKPLGSSCATGSECCDNGCAAGACCKSAGSSCGSPPECCTGTCNSGTCCKSVGNDCSTPAECCVDYCTGGICCKPSGASCNQNGTCCSGTCASGACA